MTSLQQWTSHGVPEAAARKLVVEGRKAAKLPRSKRVAAMYRMFRMAMKARGTR